MKTIHLGVIGCGSRMRGVLDQLCKATDRVKIVALCDPDDAAISATRQYFNHEAAVHSDYPDLVRDPSINWVMIGSWNCFHASQAIAALAAGKDVFCEKPLATTFDDCLAIRAAWLSSQRSFTIGFTLRYSPHYVRIKELLAAGAIGDLISFEFNETLPFAHGGFIHADWRRQTANAGPFLLEKCCHDIDLANWFTGSKAARVVSFGGLNFFRPENARHMERIGSHSVTGRLAYRNFLQPRPVDPFHADKDIVDNQVVLLEFANGVRATFHTNCNTAIPERRMYLCGSEGTLRADVLTGRIELCRMGFDRPIEDVSSSAIGQHGGGDEFLARSLAATMLTGSPPQATFDDGLCAAITCFGIDDAMAAGQVIDMRPYWERAGIEML